MPSVTHRLRSDEPFELDTFWWRPAAAGALPPEDSRGELHGTLRYLPQRGLELTVFDLGAGSPLQDCVRIPVLFGETLGGSAASYSTRSH